MLAARVLLLGLQEGTEPSSKSSVPWTQAASDSMQELSSEDSDFFKLATFTDSTAKGIRSAMPLPLHLLGIAEGLVEC